MEIQIALVQKRIRPVASAEAAPQGVIGAWVEFTGIVRAEERGASITELEYEAYETMAATVMREILEELSKAYRCTTAHVIHRIGSVPVGEAAIWLGVGAPHRSEAFSLATAFMDRLKQDVPIWKGVGLTGGNSELPRQ